MSLYRGGPCDARSRLDEDDARLRTDDLPRQYQMLRPAETDNTGKALRGAGAGNDAEAELRLTELRALGGDPHVARQRQLAAAAKRIAVDRGNGRPRKPLEPGE